jgi:hypothetical protein
MLGFNGRKNFVPGGGKSGLSEKKTSSNNNRIRKKEI